MNSSQMQQANNAIKSETARELKNLYAAVDVRLPPNERPNVSDLSSAEAEDIHHHLADTEESSPRAHEPSFEYGGWTNALRYRRSSAIPCTDLGPTLTE